jgi:hypothetical protein
MKNEEPARGDRSLVGTPLPVIANVSRIVSAVVDRITGDRVDYPLLVAAACVDALRRFGIQSQVMYGQVAWIEVLDDQSITWAGCWGDNFHFWVSSQFGEVIDLNTSVAHRKRSHTTPSLKPIFSPPMLWSADVPKFYRYIPEGVAELELTDTKDIKRYELVIEEIREKCGPLRIEHDEKNLDFANEPILCPGRRLLDDSQSSFKHFERAIGVHGIPIAPI